MSQLRRCCAAVLASLLLLGLADRAGADCPQGFRMVNSGGFGNRFNLYAWSMQVFNDRLYVGTYNQETGGEIWAYDGTTWQQVLREGLLETGNTGFRSMIVFNGYLYAGVTNKVKGAELWRTADGEHWEEIVQGGFGHPSTNSVRGLAIFHDQLYIGTQSTPAGTGGQLRRTSDGTNFEVVVPGGFGDRNNVSMHTLAVFNDQLYVGTKNNATWQEIWRSSDGVHFENVVGPQAPIPAGFSVRGNTNTQHLYVYNNTLYVGTGDDKVGFSIFRSTDGSHYQPITTNGFGDADNLFGWRFFGFQGNLWLGVGNFNIQGGEGGQLWRSHTGNKGDWQLLVGPGGIDYGYGFGNPLNWGIRTFANYRNRLYVGTAQCWEDGCQPYVTGAEIWEWQGDVCTPAAPH